ncbi:MAG: hypothetical protein HYZ16_09015 [Bacteroidetes bacterium]|nr:hypothetical protein [Bacteroidota bacterium]
MDTFVLWNPYLSTANDYYPFGMLIPSRIYTFTATTDSVRLRLKRRDATGSGSLSFYVHNLHLKAQRDTFYTDTITLATGEGYKYGFNGMEQENDWNGLGNSYDFGARILDVRLGRWFSKDGHEQYYSNKSSYQFVSNSPILMTDYNGLDNIIYIYVGEYYMKDGKKVVLTAAQQQEIFDKTVQVFEMVHNKVNGGLGVDIEFVKTSMPYNSSTLDKSDILAMAADLDFAEGVYGTLLPNLDRDDPGISKGYNLSQPAFVNMRSSGFSHTSPNYTDQIAYALAHEIIHRVTQQSGDLITDHDDEKYLPYNIMQNGGELFPLPEVPLNEWDNTLPNKDASYFTLMPSRVSDFRKVFGERSPVDNATQRNNKSSRTDGKTGIVPRKIRKDFRKWERKQ